MRRAALLGGLVVLLVGCTTRQHAKYPVHKLQGEYTVAALRFYDEVDELTGEVTTYGCNLANDWATALRARGYDAYVADLGTEAVVAVGSYPNREAARRQAEELAEVLQGMGGQQVTVRRRPPRRGPGTSTRVRGVQPVPEELERLQRLAKQFGY